MFKNISKQNFLPFVFISFLFGLSIFIESENHLIISRHLFFTIIIPNILFCVLFLLIPPKHPDLSFMFLFLSELLKFISFSIFFIVGLKYIHMDFIHHFVILSIVCVILTVLSTVFFFSDNQTLK